MIPLLAEPIGYFFFLAGAFFAAFLAPAALEAAFLVAFFIGSFLPNVDFAI
jgi:hypothetical protein